MLASYDPTADAEISYVEDPAGVEFPCHDLTDQQLWQFASGADRVIVRIADAKSNTTAGEIKRLARAVQSMIYANRQPAPSTWNFNTPSWQSLSVLRSEVLKSAKRRTLVGVQQDPATGNAVLALCFVPPEVHGCRLIAKL